VMALDVEELRELFAVRLVLEGKAVRRAAELLEPADVTSAQRHLHDYEAARKRGDIRAAVRAHRAFHFALYEAARSVWLLRLIRPAWDSCERYRPVLLAKGAVQDRHEELDVELLDACAAHDPDRAEKALHDHLELADHIFAVELKGRSIFAF
jgi:DNA-binding GntR family transcriptional regulator